MGDLLNKTFINYNTSCAMVKYVIYDKIGYDQFTKPFDRYDRFVFYDDEEDGVFKITNYGENTTRVN